MIEQIIVGMAADIEMLKSAFGKSMKVGPVAQVDPARGYRLKLGDGPGGPFLSPWYPHPESGGGSSSWMPMTVGQIVGVMNPSGDARQGVVFRAGFSDQNGPPSQDLAENVLKAFGLTATIRDGTLVIDGDLKVRGKVDIDGDVDFTGGSVRHEGVTIDSTHRHDGIESGDSNTGTPIE